MVKILYAVADNFVVEVCGKFDSVGSFECGFFGANEVVDCSCLPFKSFAVFVWLCEVCCDA